MLRRRELIAEDDVDRAFDTHHGDLGRRPGQADVAANVFARHNIIRTTVRLARDHRHLRHCRLAVRVQQFRPLANDPAVLLTHPR